MSHKHHVVKRTTHKRSEVATDTANLLLEDFVVEAGLELSLAGRGPGNVHGCLTTAEDDEILLRSDSGAVHRGISDVGLEDLEVLGGDELQSGQ